MKLLGPRVDAADLLVATVDDGEYYRRSGSGTVGDTPSGGGGGGGLSVRHDNTGTYDYTGSAESGTPEGSSGWSVTRVTLSSPVVVEHATGIWDDRASLSYS